MNYDPLEKSESSLYAGDGTASESTQQMRWQLPEERRLRVVRGGLRRDWRASGQVMGGLLLIGLLTLTLAHWPVQAHPQVTPPSNPLDTPAAASAASSLTAPYATTNERTGASFAYRSGFSDSPGATAYRHLRPPVPGLPDAYVTRWARPGANALQDGYYAVPPAAPTGLGPSVPHYSY